MRPFDGFSGMKFRSIPLLKSIFISFGLENCLFFIVSSIPFESIESDFESIIDIENPLVMDYGSGIGFNGFEILEKFPNASVVFIDINKINLDVIHRLAKLKGFLLVSSSPLTRSSYHADEDFIKLQKNRINQTNAQSISQKIN